MLFYSVNLYVHLFLERPTYFNINCVQRLYQFDISMKFSYIAKIDSFYSKNVKRNVT